MKKQTLEHVATALFFVWFVLLLPWLFLAGLAGMAFDGGPRFGAYVFVGAIWAYPVSLGLAWKFRDMNPFIVLLPFANIALSLIAGLII